MAVQVRLAALSAPTVPPEPEVDDELRELEEISRSLEGHTLSAATRRAYATAWRAFDDFCTGHGLEALPAHPETVRWYVAWMSTQLDDDGLPGSPSRRSASAWPVSARGTSAAGFWIPRPTAAWWISCAGWPSCGPPGPGASALCFWTTWSGSSR